MALTVVEERGPVTLVGLARPEKRNALDAAMAQELSGVLASHRSRPCVLVVHSTTDGIFATGTDVADLIEQGADAALLGVTAALFDQLEAHRWPTIAVIDGPALGGGCELCLACDMRIGSARARFGQPEADLGILAGGGANWRLPQTVGLGVARRMLYTGAMLDGDEALAVGLLDAIHQPAALLDEAVALAGRISERSWRALELTKLALRSQRPASTLLDVAAQALLLDSEDKRRRMEAFLRARSQRRRPSSESAVELR